VGIEDNLRCDRGSEKDPRHRDGFSRSSVQTTAAVTTNVDPRAAVAGARRASRGLDWRVRSSS